MGVLMSPSPPWGRHRSLSPWARTVRAQSWSSELQARVQLYMSHVSFWVCVVICKTGKGDVRPEVRPAEGSPTPWSRPCPGALMACLSQLEHLAELTATPPPSAPLAWDLHLPLQADTRPAAPGTPAPVLFHGLPVTTESTLGAELCSRAWGSGRCVEVLGEEGQGRDAPGVPHTARRPLPRGPASAPSPLPQGALTPLAGP